MYNEQQRQRSTQRADRHARGFPEGEQRQEGVDVWVDRVELEGQHRLFIHGWTASEQNKTPEADSSGRVSNRPVQQEIKEKVTSVLAKIIAVNQRDNWFRERTAQ